LPFSAVGTVIKSRKNVPKFKQHLEKGESECLATGSGVVPRMFYTIPGVVPPLCPVVIRCCVPPQVLCPGCFTPYHNWTHLRSLGGCFLFAIWSCFCFSLNAICMLNAIGTYNPNIQLVLYVPIYLPPNLFQTSWKIKITLFMLICHSASN